MRSLLTSGIKAILAIAVLTTAAHWAFRVQREPATATAMATIPDPVTTGSIEPRKIERAVPAPIVASTAEGLDQQGLMQLMSGASADKTKSATAASKPVAAKQATAKPAASKPVAAKSADAKPAVVKSAAKTASTKAADVKPANGKQVVAAR